MGLKGLFEGCRVRVRAFIRCVGFRVEGSGPSGRNFEAFGLEAETTSSDRSDVGAVILRRRSFSGCMGGPRRGALGTIRKLDYTDNSKGPCAYIVYTLALRYINRDYMKAKVYTI